METTFRIALSGSGRDLLAELPPHVERLADILCRECGGGCQGFMLSDNHDVYLAHSGPKIGWVVDGDTVLMRMANCKELSRVDRISQLLHLFGMHVIESRLIQ